MHQIVPIGITVLARIHAKGHEQILAVLRGKPAFCYRGAQRERVFNVVGFPEKGLLELVQLADLLAFG